VSIPDMVLLGLSTMTATINEAAAATGWSPRMLRYVEQLGLVEPTRSSSGYRLYGPEQVSRLRSLKQLIDTHGVELGDVGFALRLRQEPELAGAVADWFDSPSVVSPSSATDADWLAYEQTKHQHLLAKD
jgi:MerR family copper efflux transcriptional regulator